MILDACVSDLPQALEHEIHCAGEIGSNRRYLSARIGHPLCGSMRQFCDGNPWDGGG